MRENYIHIERKKSHIIPFNAQTNDINSFQTSGSFSFNSMEININNTLTQRFKWCTERIQIQMFTSKRLHSPIHLHLIK